MALRPKRPRDTNQLAKLLVDISTGVAEDPPISDRSASARIGGLKGGTSRAKTLTAERRAAIARKAALARWRTKP